MKEKLNIAYGISSSLFAIFLAHYMKDKNNNAAIALLLVGIGFLARNVIKIAKGYHKK